MRVRAFKKILTLLFSNVTVASKYKMVRIILDCPSGDETWQSLIFIKQLQS
jgi:hypothetical protein